MAQSSVCSEVEPWPADLTLATVLYLALLSEFVPHLCLLCCEGNLLPGDSQRLLRGWGTGPALYICPCKFGPGIRVCPADELPILANHMWGDAFGMLRDPEHLCCIRPAQGLCGESQVTQTCGSRKPGGRNVFLACSLMYELSHKILLLYMCPD